MKRDARIGLAVVLVVGLAVTLLVVRALYIRNQDVSAEHDGDSTETGVAVSPDAHRVPGADTSGAAATAAAMNPASATAGSTAEPAPSGAATAGANQAVTSFVADQTKPLTTGGVTASRAAPTGTESPNLDHEQPVTSAPTPMEARVNAPAAPAAPAAAATAAPTLFAYTPVSGDNLWKISAKIFGDGKYVSKIKAANGGSDKVRLGIPLKIPVIANKPMLLKLPTFDVNGKIKPETAKAEQTDKTATVERSSPKTEQSENSEKGEPKTAKAEKTEKTEKGSAMHKVEPGETLDTIAQKYYGSSGSKIIARIVAANHGLDPNKVKTGQELILPKGPAVSSNQ